jgi:TRAP-type C4-dicarboxylate transport system permease small subunit
MIKLYEFLSKLSRGLVWISYVVLIASSVFIMTDIVFRYCFKQPILGDVEIIEIAMAVMGFASFAFTQSEKGHIHVMMLLKLMPEKVRLLIFGINALITSAASAAVTYGCFLQGGYSCRRHLISAMLHIPSYPFYYFAGICMVLFTLILLADALMAIIGIFDPKYAKHVQKSWI